MSRPVVLDRRIPLTPSARLRALACVAAARLVVGLVGGRPVWLAGVLALAAGAPPAPTSIAAYARSAVATVSLRAASADGCLLRSVAVSLLCRSLGYAVSWRLGVAVLPPGAHAWIETEGEPVAEVFDPRLIYSVILSVDPRS